MKLQVSKADNFLRHLTDFQLTSFKRRVYEARKIRLKSMTCDELYAELIEYGLITITPKESQTGERNVTTDKQNKESRLDMDAK